MLLAKIIVTVFAISVLGANVLLALLAVKNRKQGIDCFDREYQRNPFALVAFHPEDLTEIGRRFRRFHFMCLAAFIFIITISAIILPSA